MNFDLTEEQRLIRETVRRFADEEIAPVARDYRDAKVATIYEGTSQIQKLLVGAHVLGVKAFV